MPTRPKVEVVSKANTRIQNNLLAASPPVLAEMVKKGDLKIVPAYYALTAVQVTLPHHARARARSARMRCAK